VVESDLNGLTALVTGASSGIGAETAFRFGARGAYTLIHYYKNLQGATEVLKKIRQVGGDGKLISADLSNSLSIAPFSALLQGWQRPIDILVNNAGSLIQRKPFEGYCRDDRAYHLRRVAQGNTKLEFNIQASEKSPAVNHPAFVVDEWGREDVALRLNGKPVAEGKDFRIGHMTGWKAPVSWSGFGRS
jgi:NAD(P)-dependent dehydrogenase (short-subunit alcohol dehydrogenase family)